MLTPQPRHERRWAATGAAVLLLAGIAAAAREIPDAGKVWGVQAQQVQVQAVDGSPSPAGDNEQEFEAGAAAPPAAAGGAKCGSERWKIKTLSDAEASSIDPAAAQTAVVADLTALPLPPSKLGTVQGCLAAAPHPLPQTPDYGYDPNDPQWAYHFLASNPPRGTAETTAYTLNVILWQARQESDHDFHLVLKDPSTGETMIAEISDPNCNEAVASPFRSQIAQARNDFTSLFGALPQVNAASPGNPPPFQTINKPVTVTGVAFFDFAHNQNGLAKNCVELHPVLAIRKR